MHHKYRLIELLADGHFHSCGDLAAALGIDDSAIRELVQSLDFVGIEALAVQGRGYRLANPIELLDRERILAEIHSDERYDDLVAPGGIEILPQIDSTNRYLSTLALTGLADGHACFTEYQSTGKGRRGRSWISPFGANIYLSLFRRFASLPNGPNGLSLVVGVAVVSALASLGISGVGLKWPNDLLWQGRKLGGILLELASEPDRSWQTVIGLGVNVRLPPGPARDIDQPWVDLWTIVGHDPGRNVVAGRILRFLLLDMEKFAAQGFAPFRPLWEELDVTRDKAVLIRENHQETRGIAQGVDDDGALLLLVDGKMHKIMAGDLSLRIEQQLN